MTAYTCPVEGCDYGTDEEKSANQVLGHLGSKADHPNPSDITDPLPQRSDVEDDQDDDQDTDDDMPTQEEYQEQQELAQNPEGDDDQDDDQDGGGGFTAPDLTDLGISDNMMMLGALLLVTVAIAYLVYSGDNSQDVTEAEPADVDETETVDGGLMT